MKKRLSKAFTSGNMQYPTYGPPLCEFGVVKPIRLCSPLFHLSVYTCDRSLATLPMLGFSARAAATCPYKTPLLSIDPKFNITLMRTNEIKAPKTV